MTSRRETNICSLTALLAGTLLSTASLAHNGHEGHILSKPNQGVAAPFDLVHTKVVREGDHLVFQQQVRSDIGSLKPTVNGQLGGSSVFSYVWPTSLDSAAVGFEEDQGILALAMTAHPDFDDTPLVDENGDGDKGNDGNLWHSHWVVLVPDESCGPGALKVRDIPDGTKPKLPDTWPGLPILIDSPDYRPQLNNTKVEIRVPLAAVGSPDTFNYDGVTAGLRVNANIHNPLLCVVDVMDIASGDLSLPGKVNPGRAKALAGSR
ncbi:hypothetical protein [Gallaecimonas sp. GXIMD4217]|uniref:hypothetical protein n=1 Tax=Gallaecimonas sp. GXIMD4217 TaxID=3131927 RepID=UPI00311B3BE8